jgi:hypothetical protein
MVQHNGGWVETCREAQYEDPGSIRFSEAVITLVVRLRKYLSRAGRDTHILRLNSRHQNLGEISMKRLSLIGVGSVLLVVTTAARLAQAQTNEQVTCQSAEVPVALTEG